MLKKIILLSLLAFTLISCATVKKTPRVIINVGGQLDVEYFDFDPDRGLLESLFEGNIIYGTNTLVPDFNHVLKRRITDSQISIEPGGCRLEGILYDYYPSANTFPPYTFDAHTDISYILSDKAGNVLLKKRYAEVFPNIPDQGFLHEQRLANIFNEMRKVAAINIQAFLTNKDFVRIMKEKCT